MSNKYIKPLSSKNYITRKELVPLKKIAYLLFGFCVFSDIYKIINGNFYNLAGIYQQTLFDTFIIFIGNKFLTLLLMLILYKFYKKKVLLPIFVLLLLIALQILMSTAKAPLFFVVIIFLMFFEIFNEKIKRKWIIIGLPSMLILFFSLFSYTNIVRYYGNVFGKITFNDMINNIEVMRKYKLPITENLNKIVNRLELLDNLIYTINSSNNINKALYSLGTGVELLNIIPRKLWPNKPFLYFNYFTTEAYIKPGQAGSSMGIGMIGESWFIFGHHGFFISSIYAMIFFLVYYKLFYRTQSILSKILYFNIYLAYFTADNYFFQNASILIMTSCMLSMIYIISNRYTSLFPVKKLKVKY